VLKIHVATLGFVLGGLDRHGLSAHNAVTDARFPVAILAHFAGEDLADWHLGADGCMAKLGRKPVTEPNAVRIDGDSAFITLINSDLETVIDAADWPRVSHLRWYRLEQSCTTYARSKDGILLHRVLMGDPPGMEVDHEDGNGLNNRRSNLGVKTHLHNMWNRRRSKSQSFKSPYQGVRQIGNSWIAEMRERGTRKYLGSFRTAELARGRYLKACSDRKANVVR
jgi:hypothetical protein